MQKFQNEGLGMGNEHNTLRNEKNRTLTYEKSGCWEQKPNLYFLHTF